MIIDKRVRIGKPVRVIAKQVRVIAKQVRVMVKQVPGAAARYLESSSSRSSSVRGQSSPSRRDMPRSARMRPPV